MAYILFKEMVGEKNFLKSFYEFVRRREGKHPPPYDFFFTMNDVLMEQKRPFKDLWMCGKRVLKLSILNWKAPKDTRSSGGFRGLVVVPLAPHDFWFDPVEILMQMFVITLFSLTGTWNREELTDRRVRIYF